jgi:hypothetical protein
VEFISLHGQNCAATLSFVAEGARTTIDRRRRRVEPSTGNAAKFDPARVREI